MFWLNLKFYSNLSSSVDIRKELAPLLGWKPSARGEKVDLPAWKWWQAANHTRMSFTDKNIQQLLRLRPYIYLPFIKTPAHLTNRINKQLYSKGIKKIIVSLVRFLQIMQHFCHMFVHLFYKLFLQKKWTWTEELLIKRSSESHSKGA